MRTGVECGLCGVEGSTVISIFTVSNAREVVRNGNRAPTHRGCLYCTHTNKQGSFAVGGFGGIIWLCRGQEGGWVMGGYGRAGGGGRHPRVGGYGAAPPDHAPATRGPLVLLPFSARGKQEQCSTGGCSAQGSAPSMPYSTRGIWLQ